MQMEFLETWVLVVKQKYKLIEKFFFENCGNLPCHHTIAVSMNVFIMEVGQLPK